MPYLPKEKFERITARRAPEKLAEKPKEKPKKNSDTSVFGGQSFRKAKAKIWMRRDPKAYVTTHLPRNEREELPEKWWPGRTNIEKKHVREAEKELRKKISQATTNSERFKLKREAEVLRKMLG